MTAGEAAASDRRRPACASKPKSVYRCTECGARAPQVGRAAARRAALELAWPRSPVAVAAGGEPARGGGGTRGARRDRAGRRRRRRPACATWRRARCERWRTGLPEFDFVLGGGIVPGLDDPHRRRAGHRQVHAAAAGRGAARDRRPHRALRQRRGVARPDPAPRRAAARRGRGRGARARRDPARGHPRRRGRGRAPMSWSSTRSRRCTPRPSRARPGNVGQVRECSGQLMRFAKESGTAVVVVGHVTKGGGIAGPKTLEHIVDTVLYFEGEATLDYRLLRTTKNRFGSVDELGVFSHDRARARRRAQSVGGVPRRASRRHQRQRGHRADGRHAAGAGRSPGARRQVGLRHAAARGDRPRSQAPRRAPRGARAAGRDVVRRPRRLRAGHGRRAAERAGGRSRGGGRARLEPLQPARAARRHLPRRDRPGRRDPARAERSSAASPRPRGSASAACSARRAAARRSPGFRWSGSTTSSSWCGRLPRDVGVVVVAAGRGTRLGGETPKQYLPIAGVPMVLRALRPFAVHPDVAQVALVLPPADAGASAGLPARRHRGRARRRGRRRRARRLRGRRARGARPGVHGRCWCTTGPAVRRPARSSTPSSLTRAPETARSPRCASATR